MHLDKKQVSNPRPGILNPSFLPSSMVRWGYLA